MNENKVVPNIRFKGFEDEWKKDSIKDISTMKSGGTPSVNKREYYVGDIPFIRSSDIKKESTELKINNEALKNSSSFMVKKGTVLYALYGATSGQVAISKVTGAINQAVLAIFPDEFVNKYFLLYWLSLNKGKITNKYLQGGQGNLSAKIVKNLLLFFPTKLEQQKIGDFFSKLDKLLDLQQQKIDKLELLKKALLQKLFPKHDADIPELRFKEFEDVWRKHRLKEVSKIIGGGTPDTKNPKYWNGNINWFSPNEIGNSPYAVSSHKKITDLGLKKSSAKLHPAEKTILFTSRAGIGDMAILTKPAATNQGFQSLELNNNVDSYFVYSYGFEIKKKANRLASGSTFLEISKNEMEKITLMFPSEQEQQRIGNLLSKVDQLIELENKKLQDFQQVKKCLLQNMFVE